MLFYKKTAVNPLNILTQHLRQVQKDKSQLGKQIDVRGTNEISELATNFNIMSSELDSLYRTLENMAFTDELTGMANRTLFYDRLEQATLSAARYQTEYALLVMDLNRFKNINDTLGHHIGDQLLQVVGKRLLSIFRKTDTIARLGGDEFAALLPSVGNNENARIVVEKIVAILGNPINVDDHSLTIGISIGLARCPHDGQTPNLLMQRADIAMYHAKHKKHNYTFYDESMDSENLFAVTIESALRQTIKTGGFDLHYQPKIDIKQGCITGAEALIRWTHPEHGFIPPDKFIPLAEQSGLIKPLTKWVLNTALQQCTQWHSENINIGISVNLSAYSLDDIDLLNTIRIALSEAKLEPKWLTLELTETAIMADASRALITLSRLDSMGIRLSVDDFGTGYSSLAYLKRLPVDEIKIDKSFVMDMLENPSDAVIVQSIVDLARNMGMSVVAEGIENQEVWDKLVELNCNIGQGFYMCRPCLASKLALWLQESPWGLTKK